MKYTLNKYEIQEVENATILFMFDDNNNIMLEHCIVLEGTGKIFMDCISNKDDMDDVEKELLSIYTSVDKSIIKHDLKNFIDKLIDLKLLYWSNNK